MKRLIAELLRKRTAWQLVLIAAACTAAALYFQYSARPSTLRTFRVVLLLLYGTAGAGLIVGLVRRAEDPQARGAAAWARFVGAVVGLAGLIAFVTYSFGHHRRDATASCNASVLPDTLEERRAALAEAEAMLASPFHLLPGLVDPRAAAECERSRVDLARVDQGLCTRWPIVGRACQCGEERYPYARCEEPRCMYKPGLADRFDCVGDPILPGYEGL
ncbi:MAG: hypothetical protein KC636_28960 [Myxococcales bacterium]|nr:hypothetical protein [Myxococcales bacterium]